MSEPIFIHHSVIRGEILDLPSTMQLQPISDHWHNMVQNRALLETKKL